MSDETPDLPRVSRDVRVTGERAQGSTSPGPWAGVARPFGGVLGPGVAGGEWPSAALSHLALGDILGDALAPRAASPESATAESTDSPEPESSEPTVREVVRERGAAERQAAEGTPRQSAESAQRAGPDQSEEGRRRLSMRDPVVERETIERERAPSDRREGDTDGATGPRDGSGTESTSPNRPLGDAVSPRTLLRRTGGGPAAPAPTSDRTITRLVEPTDGSSDAASEVAAAAQANAPGEESRTSPFASPVDRTMPRVPPSLAGAVGESGRGASDDAGPPTPAVASRGADAGSAAEGALAAAGSAGSSPAGAGRTRPGSARSGRTSLLAVDAPAMTVRRDAGDGSDDGARSGESGSGAADSGPGTRGSGSLGGGRAGAAGRSGGPAGTPGSGVGADDELDLDAVEGEESRVVEHVARAMTTPRVVDRLYQAIQRRQRIERERGGRR